MTYGNDDQDALAAKLASYALTASLARAALNKLRRLDRIGRGEAVGGRDRAGLDFLGDILRASWLGAEMTGEVEETASLAPPSGEYPSVDETLQASEVVKSLLAAEPLEDFVPEAVGILRKLSATGRWSTLTEDEGAFADEQLLPFVNKLVHGTELVPPEADASAFRLYLTLA